MPSLLGLAGDILEAHHAFNLTAHSALEHAKRAGDLLIEAKGQLSHGEWLPWLAGHCPTLSPRVAQGYMSIARRWSELMAEHAKAKRDSFLPIREALTLLVDEWTDPAELGAGGTEGDEEEHEREDEEEDEDDSPEYTRMFQAFFEITEYAQFRKQFDEVQRLLRTSNKTDTLKKIVRMIHSALTPGDTTTEDDANTPTHAQQLDAGR